MINTNDPPSLWILIVRMGHKSVVVSYLSMLHNVAGGPFCSARPSRPFVFFLTFPLTQLLTISLCLRLLLLEVDVFYSIIRVELKEPQQTNPKGVRLRQTACVCPSLRISITICEGPRKSTDFSLQHSTHRTSLSTNTLCERGPISSPPVIQSDPRQGTFPIYSAALREKQTGTITLWPSDRTAPRSSPSPPFSFQ